MRAVYLLVLFVLIPWVVRAQSGDYEIAEIDSAASTFTGKINGQLRTFRVRAGSEVSINGLRATFPDLEPGMKAKVSSADPGVATKIDAFGLRTAKGTIKTNGLGTADQPAREVEASIPANSADAFVIGDVLKGTRISLRYKSGAWNDHGHHATGNPDDPAMVEGLRLVIALPSKGGKGGDVLALVPSNTSKQAFMFEATTDYAGLVLRINDQSSSFSNNPGKVEYSVKILPLSH
jgi:hypothetical protein